MQELFWIAAAAQLGVLSANFFAKRMFRYRENLERVDPVVRDVFWAQHTFLMLAVAGYALLCIFFADALASGTGIGRAISGFLALFWGLRLVMQVWHYNADEKRRHSGFNWLFTATFLYLACLFGGAALGGFAR
ncbi:MAG: hypothetical protein CMJ83_02640 [Planctomycetes bacterium]|nr:hypothetical protein [Planctomycetota bacterium]